jgi:hypothetical protein
VGSTRRATTTLALVAVAALAAFGVTAAVAQSGDEDATGTDPQALLERLGELEPELPPQILDVTVTVDEEASFADLQSDATGARSLLDTVEPDLRRLYVDADDADGEVAEGVASVARGWLDVWTGSASIAAAENHDLEFPADASDELDVATGADELRGEYEVGIDLVLEGAQGQLEGYVALRELGEADPDVQSLIDQRATDAETFDRETRPVLASILSHPSTVVLVPTERFETDAPGVRSRATSFTLVCLDREAYEQAPPTNSTEELVELLAEYEVDRADCVGEPSDVDEPDDGLDDGLDEAPGLDAPDADDVDDLDDLDDA